MSRRSFEHLLPVELDFQFENARIMVIDDEPILTHFVSVCLAKRGFEHVCSVNDPLQALAQIEDFQPDLILLDIAMPCLNGLELLEQIRSSPKFKDISVVMLSASTKKYKYQALNLGAVDFIDKPVDQERLVNSIRNALRII
jgi:CheY-like chemotaxis protein